MQQTKTTWKEITINKALSKLPNSAMPDQLSSEMLEELIRIDKSEGEHEIFTICLALDVVFNEGRTFEASDNRTENIVTVYIENVKRELNLRAAKDKGESITFDKLMNDSYALYDITNPVIEGINKYE